MAQHLTDRTESAATLELLDWVASRPRSYPETIEAWRTSCPRLTIWEDALQDGLVQVVRNGGAPASIARRLAAIRACLRFSYGSASVPAAALAPRRPRRLPDAPKVSEIDALLELVDGESPLALRNRALLELVYSGGLRSAEAVALDLVDVDFERESVHVHGKGGKDRAVPLGEDAAHHLGRYL